MAQEGYCLKESRVLPNLNSFINRIAIFIFQPGSDFYFQIAITIPIKNRSGKIADRFSCSNRIPIFPEKSIRDFIFKNRIAIEKPAPGSAHHRKQEK
jgi:hypothetical protein